MELPSPSSPIEEFQAKGRAWNPDRPDVPRLLESARHEHVAPIYYGSNHCFLVTLEAGEAGKSLAVYKPAQGEYPLYDFPSGTLYRREVGSWLMNCLLGWGLVPPTVVTDGRFGVGSLQLFIESYPQGQVEIVELQRMCLLDVVLNNADRKADHCLIGEEGKLWGIDHGLTFHVHAKLRTVLWHFAGMRISHGEQEDLERVLATLRASRAPEAERLRDLLSGAEWRAVADRLERLLRSGHFPDPRYKAVPYRW
jgi:hypothetical protein